jgi:tetratricopeptide (TPR) repeat protein
MSLSIRKAGLLLCLVVIHFQPWLSAQSNHSVQAQVDSLNKVFNEIINKDIAKAEKLTAEALDLSIKAGYVFGEATTRSNLSALYLKKENNTKAIEAGFAALKIYDRDEKYKNTFEYGNTLIRLSKSFFMETDYDRSKVYGRQAIALGEKIQDERVVALANEQLGNNFAANLQVDSALHYYNKAKTIFSKLNQTHNLANIANNTGAMFSRKRINQEALKYFTEAMTIYRNSNSTPSFAIGHFNLAFTHKLLKSYDKTLQHLDSAELYAKRFNRQGTLADVYLVKAETYQSVGNLDSCANYYQKTLAFKDSLYNDTYKKELASLQTQSDVYKKETENQLLSKDKRIAELYRNLALAGIIGLAIILGFLLLNQRLRIQRRVKNQLEEEVALRTQEIFRQKETIFQTNLQMKLALNGAKFDSTLAVHVLNAIQKVITKHPPQEAQVHLAKLTQLMQYILEKSPLERIPLNEELEMLERYIQLEQLRLDHKFDYQIRVNANSQTTIPSLLLHPYVEQAIEHGLALAPNENLQLNIVIEAIDDQLKIAITDNGLRRIKGKSDRNQTSESRINRERLDLLTHLTHKNHVEIIEEVATEKGGTGTKVTIHIPLVTRPITKDLQLLYEALEN